MQKQPPNTTNNQAKPPKRLGGQTLVVRVSWREAKTNSTTPIALAMSGDDEAVRVQVGIDRKAATDWSKEHRGRRHNLFAERVCCEDSSRRVGRHPARSEGCRHKHRQ